MQFIHNIRQYQYINRRLYRYLSTSSTPQHNPHEITQHYSNRSRSYGYDKQTGHIIPLKHVYSKEISDYALNVVSYFLPKGYPSSVNDNYAVYAGLQSTAYVFSSAGSVLSMQALLFAVGLGEGAIPLAATLNWIIKDGVGQFGGVIFAGVVNNQFDSDPKRWRMASSVMMDISSLVELLTPLVPQYFLPLASVANIGKNISFLSASASRAAIHKSFAIHENLADITAKSGSQTVLASLLGTTMGVFLASQIGSEYILTFYTFLGCSSMNLLLTYLSLRSVSINTLSIDRLDVLFALCRPHPGAPVKVLCPKEFTSMERMLGSPSPFPIPLRVGVDLDRVFATRAELEVAIDIFRNENFIVGARGTSRKMCEVSLLMKEGANKRDLCRGILVAYHVRRMLSEYVVNDPASVLYKQQSVFTFIKTIWMNGFAYLHTAKRSLNERWNDLPFRGDLIKDAYDIILSDDLDVSVFLDQIDEKWAYDIFLLETRHARVDNI